MENINNEWRNNNRIESAGKMVLIAGATGKLGQRIAHHLLASGTGVKALVRKDSNRYAVSSLEAKGAAICVVDFNDAAALQKAVTGGSCLVSALSGLEEVIVGLQTKLLEAAIKAGVPRFIPSDYAVDYTKLPRGKNRNLDLRREFHDRINSEPIAATSILNGMFTDLLLGEAPVILFKWKRVLYWGDADQLLDFTTIEDTAAYTARAALDDEAPRYLRIAGEVANAHGLKEAAEQATGSPFKLFRAGSLPSLQLMTNVTRAMIPRKKEVFPPWQGMQYMHDMFTGLPKLNPLDNDRYPGVRWTSVKEVLGRKLK